MAPKSGPLFTDSSNFSLSLLDPRKTTESSTTSRSNSRYDPVSAVWDDTALAPDTNGDTLRQISIGTVLEIAGDLLLLLAPFSFLILAAFAMELDKEPLSSAGEHVEQWALLSPTLFPIIFAAVAGRALRSIARYRLERGSSLGTLEQLFGSQSVFSAIFTQWILHQISTLGICLTLFWLISPLGGQSSLRLIYHGQNTEIGSAILAQINMTGQISTFSSSITLTLSKTPVDALFISALVAPLATKEGSQDSWGNVKLPRFESHSLALDSDGFAIIPESNASYVSLVGQPIAGLSDNIDLEFTLDTMYYDLACSDLYKVPATSDWINTLGVYGAGNPDINASNFWGTSSPDYLFNSTTSACERAAGSRTWYLENSMLPNFTNGETNLNFTWLSKANYNEIPDDGFDYNDTVVANCSLTASRVHAITQCHGRDCRVTKVRKLPMPDGFNMSDWRSTDNWFGELLAGSSVWNYFKAGLYSAISTLDSNYASSAMENYIFGLIESPFEHGEDAGFVDLASIPKEDFTRRLGQMLNTYWMAAIAPRASTGVMANSNATKLLSKEVNITAGFTDTEVQPLEAVTMAHTEVYRCNKVYFFLSLISSFTLISLGLIGTVLKYMCKGPEVLGYVSTMLRHNPFTPLGAYDGAVDSSVLARRFKDTFLRLEDVNPDQDTGKVAVSTLRRKSIRSSRRQKPGRKYN